MFDQVSEGVFINLINFELSQQGEKAVIFDNIFDGKILPLFYEKISQQPVPNFNRSEKLSSFDISKNNKAVWYAFKGKIADLPTKKIQIIQEIVAQTYIKESTENMLAKVNQYLEKSNEFYTSPPSVENFGKSWFEGKPFYPLIALLTKGEVKEEPKKPFNFTDIQNLFQKAEVPLILTKESLKVIKQELPIMSQLKIIFDIIEGKGNSPIKAQEQKPKEIAKTPSMNEKEKKVLDRKQQEEQDKIEKDEREIRAQERR